jgi:outer membrane protein OmpA-like peptidoglycan-associated protein
MASNTHAYGQSSTQERVTIRRFIRLNEPRWPFLFWGLLPLLGLLACTYFALRPFAREWIEQTVRERTRAALDSNGMQWVNLAVSGQEVLLSGTEPATGAGNAAIALAEAQSCPTWLGMHTCATDVKGDFGASQITVAPAEPPTAVVAPAVMPDFQFTLDGGVLTLVGEMPSEQIKQATLSQANALVAPPRITSVIDQLTVKPQNAVDGYARVVDRGVNNVSRCQQGRSSLSQGVYALRCTVLASDETAIRNDASAELSVPLQVGDIELLSSEAVSRCEQEFADLLSRSKINFATGSAAISDSSNALLDQLATAVKACPGTVRIEGHTDSVGRLESNMTLSRDRAASVKTALVSRGVADDRLQSEGFGPNQPIDSNDSAAGRQKNRRIEFKIVTF